MALTTRFTELFGCSVPIQCAGMGTASPKLAIEIANAGGVGMVSGVMLNDTQLNEVLTEVQAQITGPLASARGDINAMAQYAGQGVSAVQTCEPARTVLRELAEQAELLFRDELKRMDNMLK